MGWFDCMVRSIVGEEAGRALRLQLPIIVKPMVEKAVEDWLASPEFAARVNQVHRERLAKMPMDRRLTRVGFIWAVAYRYWQQWRSPERDWVRCKEMASNTVSEFLRDEKCRFGDARYVWTRAGAIEVADAEIECWEAA